MCSRASSSWINIIVVLRIVWVVRVPGVMGAPVTVALVARGDLEVFPP